MLLHVCEHGVWGLGAGEDGVGGGGGGGAVDVRTCNQVWAVGVSVGVRRDGWNLCVCVCSWGCSGVGVLM